MRPAKIAKYIIQTILRQISVINILKDNIVVISGGSFGNSINGKANYELLRENFPEKKIILLSSEKTKHGHKLRSVKGFLISHFSKNIISDNGIPYSINLKNKVAIQTWHGAPIKKIGIDDKHLSSSMEDFEISAMLKQWSDTRYVICSSDSIKKLMGSAFKIRPEQFFMAHPPYIDNAIRQQETSLSIPLTSKNKIKTIMYLPTYRDWPCDRSWDLLENEEIIRHIEEEQITLYYKYHPLDSTANSRNLPSNFIKITGDYLDQLKKCDLFITDYSSALFEAALINKPTAIYATDYKKYNELRGIYDEELYKTIERIDGPLDKEILKIKISDLKSISEKTNLLRERYFPENIESRPIDIIKKAFYQ